VTRGLVAVAVLVIGACSHTQGVRLPDTILRRGGFYIPWTAEFVAHREDVLACVGLVDHRPMPSLWVARVSFGPVLAYYDIAAHAVVFSATLPMEDFTRVFRHEMLHATERTREHSDAFRHYARCNFWPP